MRRYCQVCERTTPHHEALIIMRDDAATPRRSLVCDVCDNERPIR